MGFYRQRTKCQFLCALAYGFSVTPTYGSTYALPTTTPEPPPWPAYFSPAANNNDAARQPSLPCRRRPVAPGNRTQLPPPGCAQQPHAAGQTQPARHSQSDTARPTPAQPATPSHPAGRIHPVTQLAQSTQSRHLVTTFSHQQRWCAKPARPAPAQPSGAAQGR